MAILSEAFQSSNTRVARVIVVVRLVDGTRMKQQGSEAQWLPTYGWFFDLLAHTIAVWEGSITKFIEDGAVAAFSDVEATDAINWAIRLQEEILRAQDEGRVSCDCSIGIACGSVVQFQTPLKHDDYIGEVVDRAYLLCTAANGKAIFVDYESVAAASMRQVVSQMGDIPPKRSVTEYLGTMQSVKGDGFPKPVDYYELLWARNRYGVSAPFVSDLSKRTDLRGGPEGEAESRTPLRANAHDRLQWMKGRVKYNNMEKGFGFIVGPDGEDFWFNAGCYFHSDLRVEVQRDVWFLPKDPLPNAKNRRATDILPLYATLSGELEKVFPSGYGFARCETIHGELRTIFLNLADSRNWNAGDRVQFTVGENRRGVAGNNPVKV